MKTHQPELLKSLSIIKPNFHAFTERFHTKLTQSCITMSYPTAAQFNERSYTLYCMLERIIKHLDNPLSVAPFLSYQLQFLKNDNIQQSDIKVLCDTFYATLEEHLGQRFSSEKKVAWRKVLMFFENFSNNSLFHTSNVISLEQRMLKKASHEEANS
ncbi:MULTISPECIES: globin [unclassified Pseudoalteromonas]|uniref:globin n=1 Tax=unclassified Pseudoalteromonas TaxID=194690 RepID=UPI00386D83BA